MPDQLMGANQVLWNINSAGAGLVTGSLSATIDDVLGSFYLLGTGSVQVTNTPSVSGAGTFVTSGNANVLGSVAITNAVNTLGSTYILGIGSVQVTNIPTVSGGGVFTTQGSSFLLGTGSVQVTNTPSVSGAGQFNVLGSVNVNNVISVSGAGTFVTSGTANVLGSVAVTNVPTFSGGGTFNVLGSVYSTSPLIGSVAKVEKHPTETTFNLNASFSFLYDSQGLSGMLQFTGGSTYRQNFLRSGNGELIFLSSWF